MGLFSRGKAQPDPSLFNAVAELRSLVENLGSEVRVLRLELSATSDLVTKRMRRAVAAERNVEAAHQEPEPSERPATPATPPPPLRRRWGAKGRIAERMADMNGGE